jgi:hypothetical protein
VEKKMRKRKPEEHSIINYLHHYVRNSTSKADLEAYSGNCFKWLSDCMQGASHFMALEIFQDVALPF